MTTILSNHLTIKNEMAIVDESIGTGVSWDEKAVERYSAQL